MASKNSKTGPLLHSLVEDAPSNLVRELVSLPRGENEIEIVLPLEETGDEEFRQKLLETLSEFDHDDLRPLEHRCRRIHLLAEGKGVSSLETIVDQRLDDEQHGQYSSQQDPICRSVWIFLNHRQAFQDAESFHYARQFRDHGKLYDAFEVELENAVSIDAAAIDEPALASKITEVLELKTACTVKALDLPATDPHPASIMLIVRHGGPLSSVHDHRDDGRRGTIYFRPPNEATLIYTPSKRQIEICADSPVVRQKVGDAFAEVTLEHDISQKPLTWKRYNLGRFRSSLTLPIPEIDGFEIQVARVLEVEVRLGHWSRKLALKVAIGDDIQDVATKYLGRGNIFRRADSFSRIGIAVKYNQSGDDKERSLNITVSGAKSCNLQSNKDPDERNFGFALLHEWGILSAFRQVDNGDLRSMLPQLVDLYDREEDEVSGGYLAEIGLDPGRLIEGGLLERRDRQDVVLIDEDDINGEVALKPSSTPGQVQATGPFGEDAGRRPVADLERYQINREWLQETVVKLVRPLLTSKGTQVIDQDLILLGNMGTDGASTPVYFARRLGDPVIINKLDQLLRARNMSGIGVVLSSSPETLTCLGPNVVVPLLSHLEGEGTEQALSRDAVMQTFDTGRNFALGGSTVAVNKSGTQSASLCIPGKAPLAILGANQIRIFEKLVAAHLAGSPDVKTAELIEDTGVKSPQQAFKKPMWDSILDVYIAKGPTRGYWRLAG
ncbi:hypothetical protein MED193_18679 [Roseobacter sp. MED193]|uniref:hypothetical protein n=1 Tax=Roseobacter sp. MED193 TaxID=314262 RepID=UPI000068B9E1|nr:hypothetical protein [Roseobacter sp. MED193]EAQ47247.1 hypothetical protein MED193_18679 [Roseobacter sp. MED193]